MNKHHRRVAVATATGFCGLLVIVCTHVEVRAQIVADPNAPGRQRPTVLSAPNGVPLVNIQTPSAAGVSRNTYRQFDVNGPGAILNNSRTATPTQLGGHVPGNPWLATGSARVILNEVNSTNPSYLKGPIEVAGQRAEVIVANPAGIQVNGASFINASGITITTGAPVMNEGSLESYRVRGGQVQINGLGLDTRGADYAAIMARAIEVNAAIWANYLTAVAGAAETQARHNADGSPITTPIAPDLNAPPPPKPTVRLDVAAIGGMYAGHIFLVGTEDGLGVKNNGTIASQGQLTLLPNGQLINSGRVYGQNIQIQSASEVRNQDGGVIAARESLNIEAAQIHNTEGAELLSLGKMALTATERIENRSARIEAQGDLAITTPTLLNANDHFQTELVAQPGQRYLRLRHQGVDYKAEELGMNFDRLDRYEDKAEWQVLLPSGDYPFSQYPALAAQWAVPLGGWSGSFQLEASRTEEPCPGSDCNPTTRDTYAPEHPIWQRLGVAPFGSPPEPPPQGGSEDPAWQQQMAQYNAHKRAQQDALDQKIGAYNASVAARTLEDWVVIDATATAYNPKVLSSAPGQIVSGGDMAINARDQLLNHNSEIVAGGALKVQGASLENRGSEVLARTELSGQAVYSWRREEGLFKNDDRLYEHSPYQAVQERGAPINVARSQGGQAIPPVMHSGLFKANPDSQGNTLIETDPRFTDQRQWLGSDYLLKALSSDPDSVQKRLGDGFYEPLLSG
ncbi:filamentous hemagglutinin N-terminal domain-containing protein [Hydrogenophaga sp. BPS33]|uniref:filamentous hemagglutinin N-terminal domain-containing protein n=1 Tax=Hydrogenophaga sp. BPS33 TaxID=2651974 RepID=UPI00131FAF5B|nr:filamentous hemagglutinin N-terminal domain-containing protein [Hydrogenophaga sp. BPS33]QHE87460.1 filamentous hemagglutinin N-terminal domain-containing protein [Hydrogenophaga sp. BPS33]